MKLVDAAKLQSYPLQRVSSPGIIQTQTLMPYLANVYRVFIASPGDVAEERDVIRSIVLDWNSINAATRSIILEAVGWETHSIPELGDRPQAIINKQILKQADLLIAVFWTRIGTATGSHASGTVEEIEEHLAAGKPAMIYFSDTPVRLDSVNDAQYKAVRDFREQLQKRGLVESYSGLPEFRQKLTRQFHHMLTDTSRFAGPEATSTSTATVAPVAPAAPTGHAGLSNDALFVLGKAAEQFGRISVISYAGGGLHIQAGQAVLDTSTPRLSAKWQSAVEELQLAGYIRDAGHDGKVFEVTELGYQFCEALGL